jgi:hypothetical protein
MVYRATAQIQSTVTTTHALADSGASISILNTTAPDAIVRTVIPVKITAYSNEHFLSMQYLHPIFGWVFYDPKAFINIIDAHAILTDKDKFRIQYYSNGEYDFIHKSTNSLFPVRWKNRVLMFDLHPLGMQDSH